MKVLLPLFCILLVFSCQTESEPFDAQSLANEFLNSNELDKRTTLLQLKQSNDTISGFAQNELLKQDFVSYFEQNKPKGTYVLQLETIDTTNIAYINNSVGNARSNPKHSAELSTQYLLGQKVTVITKQDGWYYIQGPDQYLAWIDAGGIVLQQDADQKYINGDKVIVQHNEAIGFLPEDPSNVAIDLVFGNKLVKAQNGNYILPDGREIVIQDNSIFELPTKQNAIALALEKANSLMGRPYLWGGTSTKGMDCSGFTRTAFMNAGYLLGRDASLQVKEGIEVNKDNISEWQAGDLLFFGNYREDGSMRVTHVAIHEESGQFIHCAQRVQEESLNPEHTNYNKDRAESLLAVRRILS